MHTGLITRRGRADRQDATKTLLSMCVVSNMGDFYREYIPKQYPWVGITGPATQVEYQIPPSREEFDTLKREVETMKKVLESAKKYDQATNQPDCGVEEKMEVLRKIAAIVGVDLDEVIGKKQAT